MEMQANEILLALAAIKGRNFHHTDYVMGKLWDK